MSCSPSNGGDWETAASCNDSCSLSKSRSLIVLVSIVALGFVKWVYADESLPPEPPISASDRQHWAFEPLVRPRVPALSSQRERLSNWPKQPIDAFVLDRLLKAGLEPAPEADRSTLLRRLSFDLLGLPPTVDEISEFQNDSRPDAYELLVEKLLTSPAYGERWAQHWLDLARFAETDGFEHDKVRPEAWRYRDWVIDALNVDLPYDEFVRQQLAGDEMSPSLRVATGFLVSGPDMPDLNEQTERRTVFLNDLTSNVSSSLLGLQMGCAQCHDHKYDPLSQHDFYRLRAFFDRAFEFKRDLLMTPLAGNKHDVSTAFLVRGDFRRPGPVMSPAFVRVVNRSDDQPQLARDRSNTRSELARWMTRADHPLTSRVIVNRLWQFHFGEGLCSTSSDFGVMGDTPVHLELLNWLATELPRRDWSLKELHRLVLTSATYRMASKLPEDADAETVERWQRAVEKDSLFRLHSRHRKQRLEGEVIRDAMLATTGLLNDRRGGPGVRPPLPPELVATLLKNQWTVSENREDWNRRSIYLFMRRNLRYPLFEAFDRPDANASCPRRNRSTIAPQALFLLNSDASFELSQRLAESLRVAGRSTPAGQVDEAYIRTLGRHPADRERAIAIEFLAADNEADRAARLADFCLSLFNLSEFIYVD